MSIERDIRCIQISIPFAQKLLEAILHRVGAILLATRMIFNFLFACLFFPYSLRFLFNQFLPRIRELMNRFLMTGCTELLYEEFPKKVFIKYINYKIVNLF